MLNAWPRLLKLCRVCHTYLTMFGLLAVSFYAVTGFMLNHPSWFGLDDVRVVETAGSLPLDILQPPDKLAIVETLRSKFGAVGRVDAFEIEEDQFVVIFAQPGRRAQATIAASDGSVEVVTETRGLAGIMSDLHRGASGGKWWKVFIDATAVLLVLAVMSGLAVWLSLPKRRFWGVVALATGLLVAASAYLLLVGR